MISRQTNNEIENKEHKERAIKELLAEIEEQLKSANQKLTQLENKFHRQRILNQLSDRKFNSISVKNFGYVGDENFDLNKIYTEIEDQNLIVSDLKAFKHILKVDYLGERPEL